MSPVAARPGVRQPKAFRLKAQLLTLLADLAPGSPLPSEREPASRYGVARATVRQALQELMFEPRDAETSARTFFACHDLGMIRQISDRTAVAAREQRAAGLASHPPARP